MTSGFRQPAPVPGNRWRTQLALRFGLERLLPPALFREIEAGLDEFGALCAMRFPDLAATAEAAPPRHIPYDAWGNRIDRVEQSPAFDALLREGQSAGMVACAHDPGLSGHGRVIQSALLFLFEPVAATATCPLAMSDAAATLLAAQDPALHARYGARLTARHDAITSGQWMTETAGGSDLSGSETHAEPSAEGWRLQGLKWFASAIGSEIALVLARTPGAPPGAAGLSLFLLPLRRPDGAWNGLEIRRLKDKLGTRAMPTAEVALCGALAEPVGGIGRGVAKAAAMLNVARLWAGQAAPATAGWLLELARDYALRRQAGGVALASLPAHACWLAGMAAQYEALLALCLETARAADSGPAGFCRLLAPAMKFRCAREGAALCGSVLESFGGAGYLEDAGFAAPFRNAQVHTIWEGTSGVMAQDVIRALTLPGLAQAWREQAESRAKALLGGPAAEAAAVIIAALARAAPLLAAPEPPAARRIAACVANIAGLLALAESAAWRAQVKQDGTGLLALRIVLRHPVFPPADAVEDAALLFPDRVENLTPGGALL